ncbi:S phase cyclin A-associated protein in the endoplasmic reticulum isoform X2 [Belonocnema kinseyi]|uniref:S phase cyclin A-associated protein in the endoplasmic reticulum isoform X2 n=1 Tax=Belonocnema kinseyi TaxID=2817044 RepID=UPI00143D2EFA|nr:S phase cyclin A-associated protein in the endoplasmic reticulum isoform X2 [Belonocnema kinseyi]
MEDVRLLIQEEGRAARNLIAFNVPVGTSNPEKIIRKPPSIPRAAQSGTMKRSMKTNVRVRSASTGRDKKSELHARYWAFLFGNLQRAVDEIYRTCEEDENVSECKEVILVLENYTRDFHNLIEWFKVKWAYESTMPPLRRTPLAWEVRKTSPCRLWNSTPKATSPLQRSSPTGSACKSPIETSFDSRSVSSDGKINSIQEEPDKINNECMEDKRNPQEKRKVPLNKNSETTNEKPLVSKVASKTPLKRPTAIKLNESNADYKPQNENEKNNVDKNQPKQLRNCHSLNRVKIANNESTGNKNSINEKRNLNSAKNLESIKNEINSNINETYLGKCTGIEKRNSPESQSEISSSDEKRNVEKVLSRENSQIASRRGVKPEIKKPSIEVRETARTKVTNKSSVAASNLTANKTRVKATPQTARPAYSTVSRAKPATAKLTQNLPEVPKMVRSKTTLCARGASNANQFRPGTSVMVRRHVQSFSTNQAYVQRREEGDRSDDINASVEVLPKQNAKVKEDGDGWQTVRSRYRRGSIHNLNMSTRFHKPSTATSLPALCIDSPSEKNKKQCFTPDGNQRQRKYKSMGTRNGNRVANRRSLQEDARTDGRKLYSDEKNCQRDTPNIADTNSTSMIAAIFKSEAEQLEKRIQQFMAAQAERERIILEEERKTEEADTQRSKQLSDEEASLQRQIMELESTEIDVDTETDEMDVEMVLEIEEDISIGSLNDNDDLSLEDRYENMLEGMSWAERMDTLEQLEALDARHPGRALELHQKLSSPSRKRSLAETLRRFQTKQACAQDKRQKLLMEKSQRLRELLNKVEDVKSAKNQLIEDKRIRMELKLKRAEENRTQHLLEIVRKAHDEDSKLKEIAFINELEAQNKLHDFKALCQEQEERLQGIQEERQRRQEEKAAKEAAAEERRRAIEAERQLRIQKMRDARREREERVGKMQLEREKERQELAREKARDREERLSALHAAQLANQEELQKKIAQKQQESARRHVENIEHIRQRAVELSILRSEEVPPTLKSYPSQKQCSLCGTFIPNEVYLLSHVKGKSHLEAVRKLHDGREPCRDELQRFNISQIHDTQVPLKNSGNVSESKAAKEKQKALKRRSRKIKQRMAVRGQEWEDASKNQTVQSSVESANKVKFRRNLKDLEKLCQNHMKNSWSSGSVASLERNLGELTRCFSRTSCADQDSFLQLSGFDILTNLLTLGSNSQNASNSLPSKSLISVLRVYKAGVNEHANNIESVLLSNKILVILDLIVQRLEAVTTLDDHSQAQEAANNTTGNGTVATGAIQLLCSLIGEVPFEKTTLQARLQDIVGYLVMGGLVDRISRHSRALIETDFFLDQDRDSPLLLASYDLLSRICCHLKRVGNQEAVTHHGENGNNSSEQSVAEAHLLSSLSLTEAAGALGALYAAIALASQNNKGSSPTPQQAGQTSSAKNLAIRGLRLLRSIAELDQRKLQNLLGTEGTSMQWRLIASHLITRLSRDPLPDKSEVSSASSISNMYILNELFVVLGYFAVNNQENQLILQSAGAGQSVLQQLCTLPFPFYGDPRLASTTLPTLLAATHCNAEATAVLSCELSYQLLEEYRNSEEGKLNPLVRLLKEAPSL